MTQMEYDAAGQLSASIDALDHRSEFGYDLSGRRIIATDALGNSTSFIYDAAGNQTAMIDANGHTTTCTYWIISRGSQNDRRYINTDRIIFWEDINSTIKY